MDMDKLSLSIPEFCERHSISRGMFYKLAERGEAPVTMKIGRRILISVEAAQDWRRRMEEKPAAGCAKA